MARGVTLVLALLVATPAVRAGSRSSCVDGDCDKPCCERDADNTTVVPVLPCCRTVGLGETPAHPAPTTLEHDRLPLTAPRPLRAPLLAVASGACSPAPAFALLSAPPLYHQHCALLL